MRDHFVARLCDMAERDPRIMLITGDLGFGVLNEYRERFPKQFINAGVAEQNMTGIAAGLALEGHVVYTYSIANFVFMRCLEQIRNDAAYHNCNVNVVCVGGGFSYGQLGVSHHATEDLSIMRSLPSVKVVSPADHWEAAEATEAISRESGVCYLRLDKSAAENQQSPDETFELGKARQLREGQDVTLIATGGIMSEALEAADTLQEQGIFARVLSLHTIKPLDQVAVIAAAKQTGGVITIEEHTVDGGLGSAVAETLLENDAAPGFFRRMGLRGGFASIVGSQSYLRQQYGLDAEAIVGQVATALPARFAIVKAA
ncbi:transketolase family protein [Adhaeretor mobilis]|uniref:1-deoxy-D-xylulose-5-phosphate synthase n=1 Tax=Adhaeretor mobilis TaxID=1930276 RepID=A0A517MY43_9BACT|nr:transketolase C-terminal domain-containing protein [Adhaeretor mobilis]QDS99798.1 1-deoxy-D-xylulose-5-phosphate synthase [Adhaeretor mobilis]